MILVRIDLTKPYIGQGFENWLSWHFCDILFRKYDGKKLDINLGLDNDDLVEILEDKYPHARNTLEFAYSKARSKISGASRPPEVEKWLFDGLFEYLTRHQGIGFVFAVDGLDKLGLTADDEADYRQKSRDVREVIFHENAPMAVYLVTMRYETFLELRTNDPYRKLVQLRCAYVGTQRIFDNKIRRLEERRFFSPHRYPTVYEMSDYGYRQYARELARAFVRFGSY